VLLGCGIAAYIALTFEPAPLATAGALAAAAIVRWRWREGSMAAIAGGALFAAVLGFALAQGRAHISAAPVIPSERSSLKVTGWIELVEPREERGERVTIRVQEIVGLGASGCAHSPLTRPSKPAMRSASGPCSRRRQAPLCR
jgi:competence protein ComEC